MFRSKNYKWSIKLTVSVLPVMLIVVTIFFTITSRAIITMTKRNMSLNTTYCINELYNWTNNVVGELNVYKNVIENNFSNDDQRLREFILTTYGKNQAYPLGIIVGDNNGFYANASGWIPGDDWVLVERPWYIDGRDSEEFSFCEPYTDAILNKTCLSASARLHYNKSVRVITADVYLDHAQELVNGIISENVVDGAMFVANDSQIILADSDNSMTGQPIKSGDALHQSIFDLLKSNTIGQNELKVNGIKYYVTVEQMENTGWFMVTYVKKSTVLGTLYTIELIMAFVAIAGAVMLTFITNWYARTMNDMQTKAKTDNLTGILNREGFRELAANFLREHPDKGALVIFDMDNFKSVNDTLGHPEGDKVLREYAELLENFFNRKFDAVCRLGGDEFAVFIGGEISVYSLKSMLMRFKDVMKDYFKKEYADYKLSSSIGAALVKENMSYEELYRLADEALYEVKRNGKDSFRISTDGKYVGELSEQASDIFYNEVSDVDSVRIAKKISKRISKMIEE